MSKAWSHYYKRVGDIRHFVENELPGIAVVDQERLGLFGQSGGGISSFHYANAFIRQASDLPDVSLQLLQSRRLASYTDRGVGHWDKPLLLIAPEKDALNPYEGCLKLGEQSESTEVLVLKGASHAYDWPYPARTVFVVGRNVRMWPSHGAKEEARAATIDFFGEYLLD